MSAEPMREIVVQAALDDHYDGVIRLLGDAQRFGFELRGLTLGAKLNGIASARITLGVSTAIDAPLVAARLARHPAVLHVEARAASSETPHECLQALAA